MKKLLSILGAISLTATGVSSVVACSGKKIMKILIFLMKRLIEVMLH